MAILSIVVMGELLVWQGPCLPAGLVVQTRVRHAAARRDRPATRWLGGKSCGKAGDDGTVGACG